MRCYKTLICNDFIESIGRSFFTCHMAPNQPQLNLTFSFNKKEIEIDG